MSSPPTSPAAERSPLTSPLIRHSPPTSPARTPEPNSSDAESRAETSNSSASSSPPRKRRYMSGRQSDQVSRNTIRRWQALLGSDESSEKVKSNAESAAASANNRPSPRSTHQDATCVSHHPDTSAGSESDSSSTSCRSDGSSISSSLNSSYARTVRSSSSSEAESVFCESDESDSSVNNDSDNDEALTKIYKDSSVSKQEAVLHVVELFTSSNLTKVALQRALKTICGLLPPENLMPRTLKTLFKYIKQFAPPIHEKKVYYCSKCFKELQNNEECAHCKDAKRSAFHDFPVDVQLKHMFEHRNLADIIDSYKLKRAQSDCNYVSDIVDGTEYHRATNNLQGAHDVTLLWNTDGIAISGSSNMKLWVILCVIAEVPPRSRSSYVIVAGVWCDEHEPPGNLFLKPFVTSLKKNFEDGGITWTHPRSEVKKTSQVIAPALSADAPAKAMALNVKLFSYRYGCNICEVKTTRLGLTEDEIAANAALPPRQRKKRKRVYLYREHSATLRTGRRMEQQGVVADREGQPVKGVKGHAVVSELPFLDRGGCVTVDYLHTLLLGVVHYFVNIWLNVPGPWYIGNKEKIIDEFIKSIKVPFYFKRLPRGLGLFKKWKASELRQFLLFYSLPALQHHLPELYFQHWLLLVGASYILLQDKIPNVDLDKADIILRIFVRDIGVLYGAKYYTYNVHQLLHFSMMVKRWGPLWATSTFIFENYNGVLGKLIHGTKNMGQELINNLKISLGVQVLSYIVSGHDNATNVGAAESTVLGKSIIVELSPEVKAVVSQCNIGTITSIHLRAKFKNEIFTCRSYDHNRRQANSYVKFVNSDDVPQYGEIVHVLKSELGVFCVIQTYRVLHTNLLFHAESRITILHLVPVELSDNYVIVALSSILEKTLKIGMYLSMRPNLVEKNL